MILINHAAREMTAKVVYYGPGLCGKTTNLIQLHEILPDEKKGKMLSLATKQDRTLFFDLLPVEVGKIKGMKVRIQLYTVPGQVFYDETRRLVLKGADAVVFVVDSQPAMVEANLESFENLKANLQENGIDFDSLPIIIQYNKRDIPGVLPVEELIEKLNFADYPHEEAVAVDGTGVKSTFHMVVQHLMLKLAGKSAWKKGEKKAAKSTEKTEEAPAEEAASETPSEEPLDITGEPASDAPIEIELPSSSTSLEDTSPGSDDSPISVLPKHDYDKVEEVDLTKLLEERKRHTVVVNPDEPILELSADQILEDGEIVDVDVTPEGALDETAISQDSSPSRVDGDLENKVETMIVKLGDLRDQIDDIIKFLKE